MRIVGFENGARVVAETQAIEPVEGLCHTCGHTTDLECGKCRSIRVVPVQAETSVRRAASVEKFRKLLLAAQASRNSKYFLGCILIAIGDPAAAGVTMTEFGKHWNVGRAAVSKTVNLIRLQLGLQPSQYMKSEKSRERFRSSNRRPFKRK